MTVQEQAAKQGAGQSHPKAKSRLGLLPCDLWDMGRGTAESWSKKDPAFLLSAGCGRVLAEPGGVRGPPSAGREGAGHGGGQGAPARAREGVWGKAEQGAGHPGSTARSHWPPHLLVPREAELRGAQRGKDLSLLPGRKEGKRSKPAKVPEL